MGGEETMAEPEENADQHGVKSADDRQGEGKPDQD